MPVSPGGTRPRILTKAAQYAFAIAASARKRHLKGTDSIRPLSSVLGLLLQNHRSLMMMVSPGWMRVSSGTAARPRTTPPEAGRSIWTCQR